MKAVFVSSMTMLYGIAALSWGALDTPVVESLDSMKLSAEAGDPSAQYNVGIALRTGKFGTPDEAGAIKWWKKAADSGVAEAQYNLALALVKGEGTKKDEATAAKWFYAAATQGLFEAQLALIRCYAKGLGLPANAEKAFTWDCIARRTLELRTGLPAGVTPNPAVLRPDGFAEYTNAAGKREAIGPDGTLEQLNSDGSKTQIRANGSVTNVGTDGMRETKLPDGSSQVEHPDGRTVTTDRNGTVETKFPDGTRTLQGDAKLADGRTIRLTEKFDADGESLSRRFRVRHLWIEQFTDRSENHEIDASDSEGRTVKIIDRFSSDGTPQERRIVRNDGVERKGDEIWVLTYWIDQPDGSEAKVREKLGLGGSSHGLEVVEVKKKPSNPEPARTASVQIQTIERVTHTAEPMTAPPQVIEVLRNMGGTSVAREEPPKIDLQVIQLLDAEREARYYPGVTVSQAQKISPGGNSVHDRPSDSPATTRSQELDRQANRRHEGPSSATSADRTT